MESNIKISRLYELFREFPKIVTDSRKITENSLFFALKGENFNGNLFAAQALEAGAVCAIVDDPSVAGHDRCLLVHDVLETLQQLATYHRMKLGLPILAITGTNGKTTTKELVSAVLSSRLKTEYTRGNLNNHIGVPLTLLSMTKDTEIGVVEMGANHPGEIDFLCRIAIPDLGLVTNMGKAHLEGFGGFDGVIRTKSELYRFIENKEGTIFINTDNDLLTKAAGPILHKVSYGTSQDCAVRGEISGHAPFLRLSIHLGNEKTEIQTNLVGDYNFENVLAAATVGTFFGIPSAEIKKAVENYFPSNNRSQQIKTSDNTIIMDAYNANPTSMEASIRSFFFMENPHKVLILGDMLELGDNSRHEHQNIIDLLETLGAPSVFLVGPWFLSTEKPDRFRAFESADKLAGFLRDNPVSDSLILIKGSRGIQLEKILPVFN